MTQQSALQDQVLDMVNGGRETALRYFRRSFELEFKSDESPVTEADKAIERKVRAYLQSHFPNDGIFGEEFGVDGGHGETQWIIDPIDGTRSFLSGHPLFGFLLAKVRNDSAELGVIGMPVLNETYLGIPGEGATLNGSSISVSTKTELREATIYINEGDKIYVDRPKVFDRLMKAGQTRRMAHDCYPHALLAAGHVDVVVDYDLKPYDFFAVSAVVEAAGGRMSDWLGGKLNSRSDGAVVSAATPTLQAAILDLLNA